MLCKSSHNSRHTIGFKTLHFVVISPRFLASIDIHSQAVSEGDVEEVSRLLKQAEEEAHAAKAQLCHPLCNCQKCTALEDK